MQTFRLSWISLTAMAALLGAAVADLPLQAQPLPPTDDLPGSPPARSPLPLPTPLPDPADLLPSTPPPTPPTLPVSPTPTSNPSDTTLTVQHFEVVGSTVFSPEELDQVTAPFTQRPLTLTDLFQVRSAITQLYLDRGYITSGAYLPPQDLENGVVKIQVVEGGVEEIRVKGLHRLDPGYIQSRLGLAAKAPLNQPRLLAALQLLQQDPLIATISAELAVGTRPGANILEVTVTEAPTTSVQLELNNQRVPSVGRDVRLLRLSQANLLGLGDSLSVSGFQSDGSQEWDFSYTLPVSPHNTTVALRYRTVANRIVEQPFQPLDITSDSRDYEITVRHPLIQTPEQELAIGATLSRRESETALFNGSLPLPVLGSDLEGKTRESVLRLFQELTQRNSREVLALRSQFNWGLNLWNPTINASAPDSQFFSWQGQAQYLRLLAPDTFLILNGAVQWSDRPLVELEQFSVGGLETVRGYRQDLLRADSGIQGSAEIRIPLLRWSELPGLLQIVPSFNLGSVWNQGVRPNPDPGTLASLGLGLRFQLGEILTARVDYGMPLISADQLRSNWQENSLYYSLLLRTKF